MSTQVGNIGVYLVNGIAGNEGMPGAPILHFSLLVNVVTGAITGHAEQTQAVAPPHDKIKIGNVTGRIRPIGLGKYIKIVDLEGSAIVPFGPPPLIGEMYLPFDAIFVIDDAWTGVGGWTLGSKSVENVPVHEVK